MNSNIRCMVGLNDLLSFPNVIFLWYLGFEPCGKSEKGLRNREKMIVRNYVTESVSRTNSWKNLNIFMFSFVINQNVLFIIYLVQLPLLNDVKILPNTFCIK